MASRKTVTLDNLMALGPERLAVILVELADGNAEVKRRLRLELAAQTGGNIIAAEIGKRLAALRSARSFIDWQRRRDFVRDLDLQRAMIVDRVTPTRADLAQLIEDEDKNDESGDEETPPEREQVPEANAEITPEPRVPSKPASSKTIKKQQKTQIN